MTATPTNNLKLQKPAYVDAADVAVLNGNFDRIDAAIGALPLDTSVNPPIANESLHSRVAAIESRIGSSSGSGGSGGSSSTSDEFATKGYVDSKVQDVDLTDYATKEYVDQLLGDIADAAY